MELQSIMPWKEVSPGRFERAFSSLEEYYQAIGSGGAPLAESTTALAVVPNFESSKGEEMQVQL